MKIDAGRFRDIVRSIHAEPLAVGEVEAIVALAQLAVDADGGEGPDEIAMFFAIGKGLFELAGLPDASIPTFADGDEDGERVRALAATLVTPASRELAYAVARVLTVADITIAPAEHAFLEGLRATLAISDARATTLTTTICGAITP